MRATGLVRPLAVGTASIAVSALAVSCFTGTVGLAPPVNVAYFPTAMIVSPGRSTLYVANSDFDLQYSGGTMLAIDLASPSGMRTMARTVANAISQGSSQADACRSIDTLPNDQVFAHPGPCTPVPIGLFVKKFATIGAFASQSTIVNRTDGQPGSRLFVTVRGDPSVTYFDIVDDRDPANPVSPCGDPFCLSCSGSGAGNRCSPSHLIGTDPFDNLRGLKMPTEPTGIDVVELGVPSGDPIVVAHQATAQASLIVNRWPGTGPSGPTLEFSLGSLPDGPIGVVRIPPPAVVKASNGIIGYQPGFIVSHRTSAALSVVRYIDDAISEPERPYLQPGPTIPITLSAQGNDSRSMAIDSAKRDVCEANCGSTMSAVACLQGCLDIPLDLYVVSRAPSSLMIGQIKTTLSGLGAGRTGVSETISLDQEEPLPTGASGIALSHIVNKHGDLEARLFIASFDSRMVTVWDPKLPGLKYANYIRTGRGPFGMAFDVNPGDPGAHNAEAFLYIGNFTDSYVSVVDLTWRPTQNGTFPTFLNVLLNAGPPSPPKGDTGQFQ